jgi:ABC-type Fe3+ transport system substrate-binding protein
LKRRKLNNFAKTARLSGLAVFLCLVTITLRADDELVIASPHWEGIQHEFGRAFTKHYAEKFGKKITVRWRDLGGASQIEKAVDATYKATPDSCGIDVFFGGGMDPYENQKHKGHLQAYRIPPELLSQLPTKVQGVDLIDPDFTFYGAALSSFGIVENLRVIERLKLPKADTWEDLTNPALYSWISSADPRKSGSVHMIYEVILQAYGWEKGWAIIQQMSGNVRSFMQASSAPTKEVSIGDAAYAPSIDINGLTQQAFLGKDNVRFRIPPGVSVINPDGIAIFKGAPHLPAAQAFVDFVMSEPGQSLWMKPVGAPGGATKYGITRMGVWPKHYEGDLSQLLVPLNPFAAQAGFVYNSTVGSRRWSIVNDLMGQTVIDVHPHLQAAWAAIIALPPDKSAALKAEFSQPFLREDEANELNKFWRSDKVRSGRIANEWMSRAVSRYQSIRQRALQLAALKTASAPSSHGAAVAHASPLSP